MDQTDNPTAQKLFNSFMQFNRGEWHHRTFAGCTSSELRVLFCIRKCMRPGESSIKVSEISKQLHVTVPSITQLLKILENRGLIERHSDPTDRRTVCIQLSPKGITITQQASDAFAKRMHGLIEFLGEDESNHLADLLTKMFRYLNEKAANERLTQWNGEEEA